MDVRYETIKGCWMFDRKLWKERLFLFSDWYFKVFKLFENYCEFKETLLE